jgi:hypothetical protein
MLLLAGKAATRRRPVNSALGRMKESPPLNMPARLSIAALLVLGLLGGTLIVAYSGYETSPRRGGTPVFVPAPQAYIIAAAMYGMSCLAMLALLRNRTKSFLWSGVAVAGYVLLAWLLAQSIGRL